MLISHLFLGLLSFLEAEKNPSNFPECKVMSTVASHLKEEIKIALQKDAVCQRNIHCTGTSYNNTIIQSYFANLGYNTLTHLRLFLVGFVPLVVVKGKI